jgi:aspartate/methionine/tyrosine aminotransferase
MGAPFSDNVELVSMHSVSKGILGECGLRGGYVEFHNVDLFASDMLYKLKSVELCSNTVGQLSTYLMCDPPKEGRESSECVTQYQNERSEIFNGMKERAMLLTDTFNQMDNTSSNRIEGAMYAFP